MYFTVLRNTTTFLQIIVLHSPWPISDELFGKIYHNSMWRNTHKHTFLSNIPFCSQVELKKTEEQELK